MSYQVYPTVRGIAWPVKRSPNWETQVQKMSSGAEVRLSYYDNPLHSWEISYGGGYNDSGYLKDNPNDLMPFATETDLAIVEGFYNQMQGRFGLFLYDDLTPGLTPGTGLWDSVTGQPVGTGDGVTTTFQLIRTVGGFTEAIQTPYMADGISPPPIVYGNGIPYTYATDYSVDNLGRILFVHAPPSSPVTGITADFSYYWPVRFDEDSLEFENMLQYLWAQKSIKLRQVRL